MNKTKIDYADYTWNPVTGCVNHCSYCYARKMYDRFRISFEPMLHFDRLLEPLKLKKPAKIFVGSVTDLWGQSIPQEWRDKVYDTIRKCPQHIFMVLTKQAQNVTMADYDNMPDNVWFGITVVNGNYPYYDYQIMADWEDRIKFVSVEPLLGNVVFNIDKNYPKPNWIIIGALTGQKYDVDEKWIKDILYFAFKNNISVFMKSNLKPYWRYHLTQRFPK